jgi:hypothetical protein
LKLNINRFVKRLCLCFVKQLIYAHILLFYYTTMSISFDNGNIVLTNNGFTTTLIGSSTSNATITLPSVTTVIGAAGSNSQIQYNNAGVYGGAANLTIDTDQYPVVGETTVSPTTPFTGAKLFGLNRGGIADLYYGNASLIKTRINPCVVTKRHALYVAAGGSTTITAHGTISNVTGTATVRNQATTNLFVSTRRIGFVSAATAGSSSGQRHGIAQFCRGPVPFMGGFRFICRFGTSSATAIPDQRSFVGMHANVAALTNQDPGRSTLGMIGFCVDLVDTDWFFVTGVVGSQGVKVQLSPTTGTFPSREQSVTMYEAQIFCAPNSSSVSYSLEVISNATVNGSGGAYASGTVSANLPAATVLLAPQVWTNNGNTAAAAGIDIISMNVETEY